MKFIPLIIAFILSSAAASAADDSGVKLEIEKTLLAAANSQHENDDYHSVTQLTAKLAANITKQYADAARQECGKNYKAKKEVCGYDFDPIICGQDSDKPKITRLTTVKDAYVADVTWFDDADSKPASYRLTKQGGALKIDGISCNAGKSTIKFNW